MSCVITNIIKMRGIAKLPLYNNGDFDFNKIIPMPTSLEIENESFSDQAIVCYLTDKCSVAISDLDHAKIRLLEKTVGLFLGNSLDVANEILSEISAESFPESERDALFKKGEMYIYNYVNYGDTTWYDWCCHNWGTCWNAANTDISGNHIVTFKTTGGTIEPVIKQLSAMYPEIRIDVMSYSLLPEHYSYLAGNKIS